MDIEKLGRFRNFMMPIIIQIPIWAQAYKVENEEIERQILLAHAWAENNPKRAPKKDMLRYLNNWMSIADVKGSMRRGVSAPIKRAPEPEPDMTPEEMHEITLRNMPPRHIVTTKIIPVTASYIEIKVDK